MVAVRLALRTYFGSPGLSWARRTVGSKRETKTTDRRKFMMIPLVPRLCLGTHVREALPRVNNAPPYGRFRRGGASRLAFPGRAWERGWFTSLSAVPSAPPVRRDTATRRRG